MTPDRLEEFGIKPEEYARDQFVKMEVTFITASGKRVPAPAQKTVGVKDPVDIIGAARVVGRSAQEAFWDAVYKGPVS